MPVTFWGNGNNDAYMIAREFRKRGIDTRLVYPTNAKPWSIPRYIDPSIKTDPQWMTSWHMRRRPIGYLDAYRSRRAAEKIGGPIITSALWSAIFARTRSRLMLWVHGQELRSAPFRRRHSAYFIRDVIRRAEVILSNQPDHWRTIEKLGLEDKHAYIPTPLDPEFWQDPGPAPEDPVFRVLAPAENNFAVKGTDKIIRGFAKFISGGVPARLTLMRYGHDLPRSEALVRELEIPQYVEFRDIVPPAELRTLERGSACVIDSLNLGLLGMIGLQALCMNIPAVCSVNEGDYSRYYSDMPPVANASDEEGVTAALHRIYDGHAPRGGREWILKYHAPAPVARALISGSRDFFRGELPEHTPNNF